MSKNLVYDIHDTPKFGKLIVFAVQQLLSLVSYHLLIFITLRIESGKILL